VLVTPEPRAFAALRQPAPEEHERLAQWWRGLDERTRAAFLADPGGPIPDEYLDQVMAGGVRIIGELTGGPTMRWTFSPTAREFIATQLTATST
jgi:hypothetical protein